MANITAQDVNTLRKQTGAGMMDCKNALIEANGDFDAAIDILRKKGQKVANKRADREAREGIVIAKSSDDHKFAAVIMINCETDFVAKNQEFVDFANKALDLAIAKRPATLEELKSYTINGRTIAEGILDMVGKTGEKMDMPHYDYITAPKTFVYNHHGNRLSAILGFNQENTPAELGHEVAMQIAAMNPIAIDKDYIPQNVLDREMDIARESTRNEGKPENMIEKIATGKMNKFFKESTLLNQDFIRDGNKTVGQYISEFGKDLKVTEFKRLMLGI